MRDIVQIIMAFLGSAGFALIFNVKRGHVLYASVNGMLSWIVYFIINGFVDNVLVSTIVASVFAAVYAYVIAKVRLAPANQFLIIGLIPLIPGANLYYTMYYAFLGDWVKSSQNGFLTVQYALGIAIGISLVWAIIGVKDNYIKRRAAQTN